MKIAVFWVVAPCDHRPDVGGSKDHCNVGKLLPDYTVLQPRRQQSSKFKSILIYFFIMHFLQSRGHTHAGIVIKPEIKNIRIRPTLF
jgi:hypothetical protein